MGLKSLAPGAACPTCWEHSRHCGHRPRSSTRQRAAGWHLRGAAPPRSAAGVSAAVSLSLQRQRELEHVCDQEPLRPCGVLRADRWRLRIRPLGAPGADGRRWRERARGRRSHFTATPGLLSHVSAQESKPRASQRPVTLSLLGNMAIRLPRDQEARGEQSLNTRAGSRILQTKRNKNTCRTPESSIK